jgi:hypothetical protein
MKGYIILLKSYLDEDGVLQEAIEQVPHNGNIGLKKLYELIGCDIVDVKETQPAGYNLMSTCVMLPAMTLVFDDEFLLKTDNPQANRLASVLNGYPWRHSQCLCGNVVICDSTEDGEMVPFDEEATAKIVSGLEKLYAEAVDHIKFKVQQFEWHVEAF